MEFVFCKVLFCANITLTETNMAKLYTNPKVSFHDNFNSFEIDTLYPNKKARFLV